MNRRDSFNLFIPGKARGQGRARFARATGHAYTPAETRAYAEQVQTEWIAAGRPALERDIAFEMVLAIDVNRPAGHFRKDGGLSAEGLRKRWPGKPDVDNVVKLVLDALCAVDALPDDRYLVKLTASKNYASDDRQGVYVYAFSRAASFYGAEVA